MKIEMDIDPNQQIFTHIEDNGKSRSFLVETMAQFANEYPKAMQLKFILASVDASHVEYLRINGGIEQHRLDRLKEPYSSIPLIGIEWEDKTIMIVDGNHRMIKAYEEGRKDLKMVIFKFPFWENFLLPEELTKKLVKEGALTNHSNIT